MTSDVRIRPEFDTQPSPPYVPIVASQLSDPCAHGLVLWRIDGELWHVVAIERGHPVLHTCDAQPKLVGGRKR